MFQFTLPTGTKITVSIVWWEWQNVYVVPSGEDYQSTGGVCGYISGPRNAEFRLRDGTVTDNPITFANDWYACDRCFNSLLYNVITFQENHCSENTILIKKH